MPMSNFAKLNQLDDIVELECKSQEEMADYWAFESSELHLDTKVDAQTTLMIRALKEDILRDMLLGYQQ